MPASPGPRGPYRKGIQRRQEIIIAAAQIFAKYGYLGGSLRQIASEVGVSAATLVSHFEHKEGLLVAVLQHWKAESGKVKEGAEGIEFFLRLPKLMQYHFNNRGMLELFITLSAEATNPEHPAREFIQAQNGRTLDRFSLQLRAAQEEAGIEAMSDGAVEEEVRALMALMDGLELQWLLNGNIDLVGTFTRQLLRLLNRWTRIAIEDLEARYRSTELQLT